MTVKYVVIGAIMVTLLGSGSIAAAFASGLSRSDFAEHPEAYCMGFGNNPKNQELCADVDICDEEGEIKPDHQFCTGEAVTHPCPDGFHMLEDDESGLCYSNDVPCPDYTILKDYEDGGHSCVYYKIQCEYNENNPLCNGEERSDGITVCDEPDHPGYKFCN